VQVQRRAPAAGHAEQVACEGVRPTLPAGAGKRQDVCPADGNPAACCDDDVAEAAAALAATFETAVRGVIYEHRATSGPAARLAAALAPVLAQAGQQGGTPFQRDAAVVLRRLEDAARQGHGLNRENPRALVELLGRVIRKADETAPTSVEEPARLIVP